MNTKKTLITAYITTASLWSITACQKDNTPVAQPDKVTFNITTPAAGAIYHKGDTVNLKAEIGYISEMHGYTLQIVDINSGNVLYTAMEDSHGEQYTIAKQWVDTLSAARDLKMAIKVEIDHDGHEANSYTQFKSQP